jgi:hypothetical protein
LEYILCFGVSVLERILCFGVSGFITPFWSIYSRVEYMPPKGYRHLSIKEEVYSRLEEFAKRKGLSSVADAVVVLLDYADIYSKIEYILQRGVNLPQSGVRETPGSPATQGSTKTEQHATKSGKRSAVEVLRDQKVTCVSDLARAGKKNPEAIIESARRGGAVVVRTDEDVCAVDPEYWELFKKRLSEVKTPDDKEVLSRLKDERMKRLFQLLRKAGALYLDSTRKPTEWVFDYNYIEEPEEGGRRREEELPLDWELE